MWDFFQIKSLTTFLLVGLLAIVVSQASLLAAPYNDNFSNAQQVSGISGNTTGTNVYATVESGESTSSYYDEMNATIWYRWTAPVSGGATFSTKGSDFSNSLAVYTGSAVNNLSGKGYSRSDSDNSNAASVTFNAVAGITYSIQVDGDGEWGNVALNWKPGPTNDNFSNSQTLSGMSVDVTGTNYLASAESGESTSSYYDEMNATIWYRWTAPVSGGATFSTKGSDFSNSLAVYTGSAVNNLSGKGYSRSDSDNSNAASVTFNAVAGITYSIQVDGDGEWGNVVLYGGQAPANDMFANAQPLYGSTGSVKGINLPASSEPGEPNHAGVSGGSSVWYRWTAPKSGNAVFNTDGSDFDTLLAVYTGNSVNGLTSVASDDNYAGGINGSSQVSFYAVSGRTYSIAIDGNGGATGHFHLEWATGWNPISIAAGSDGKTRLLWKNANGAASFWTVDAAGRIGYSATYGPYSGWTAAKIEGAPNGATEIFWTTGNGACSYWIVSSSGAITFSPTYGPYSGWIPIDFSANGDGSVRLLWTSPTGAVSFWTIAANGSIRSSPTYGPYSGWSVAHVAAAPGGTTRLLWHTASGAASVWSIATNNAISYSPTFGPFTGWNCADIGVGNDGKTKLQWNNGGATSFWTLSSSNAITYSPVWGAYSGWSPTDFAVAPDNSVRLLWGAPSGAASFWSVSPGFGIGYSQTYGPF